MGDYRRLRVWAAARTLTIEVYRLTDSFPQGEQFGLVSQLRSASSSIGANLAEGFGRSSDRDTARFIDIAIGSANEVEHLVVTSRDVGYIAPADADGLAESVADIRKMLTGLRRTIRQRSR